VISCPERSDIFSDFFEVFPAAGLTGDGKTFSTLLAAVVFGRVCLSAGAATTFCVIFAAGFATDLASGAGTTFATFTGVTFVGFAADLAVDLDAFAGVFATELAEDFGAGFAADFPAFGAGLADAFLSAIFAAAGLDPDLDAVFGAGLETGFTDFFTLEDTGLTGFAGFFGPFDAPDFTTLPADALEGFVFIAGLPVFFGTVGEGFGFGFPADFAMGLATVLALAAGFDLALLRAPFGAFFFADGMGLGGCWVGSPRLDPTAALRDAIKCGAS
jgi:hypothetical protein